MLFGMPGGILALKAMAPTASGGGDLEIGRLNTCRHQRAQASFGFAYSFGPRGAEFFRQYRNMHIFIDESGSFAGFHEGSISVVGAIAIPDVSSPSSPVLSC
jgi:hypothetical protein